MGILRRIAIAIATVIGWLIVLFTAIALITTITTFNEKIATAYNSSYQEAHDQAYDTRYQEGYNKAYQEGYDEGYENGLEIGYKEGLPTDVILHNPTYTELMDFLRRDKTDSKPYIEGEYVSSDFAAEVNNNAELEGIRAAFVGIYFPQPPGHGMVAFETIDKGLIFIEPQLDRVAKPVIGKSYWQSVGWSIPTDYDDTVVEIQIIW